MIIAKTTLIVYVADDDDSVRASLKMLIESAGNRVVAFKSAEDFLGSGPGRIRVA